MTVHLVYIDDSKDEMLAVYSAIMIEDNSWLESFRLIKDFRAELKRTYDIYVYKELHATDLIAGRGNISMRTVTKYERSIIYKEFVELAVTLPSCKIIDACMPRRQEERAFERLLNRINRTMQAWGSHAILFCDEGKNTTFTQMVRRMSVHNPISSQFGTWSSGKQYMNIPLNHILEDPVFKDSEKSYFVQLADSCAYALLRRENQLASKNKYGIHDVYNRLLPIKVREANRYDSEGVIR